MCRPPLNTASTTTQGERSSPLHGPHEETGNVGSSDIFPKVTHLAQAGTSIIEIAEFTLSLPFADPLRRPFLRDLHAQLRRSCPTLCDPVDSSPPGSSVQGILQARILEQVAISSSRGASLPGSNLSLLGPLHWQADSLPLELPRET